VWRGGWLAYLRGDLFGEEGKPPAISPGRDGLTFVGTFGRKKGLMGRLEQSAKA